MTEDRDTEELLERVLKLEEDNNRMLHKIRNHARWSAFFSFVYWAVIIGSSAAAFYYLQPILAQLTKAYESIAASAKKANGVLDSKPFQDLQNAINKFSPSAK